MAPTPDPSDLCNFVKVPDTCKCTNAKYEKNDEDVLEIKFDLVSAVDGVPCIAEKGDGVGEPPTTDKTNIYIDTDQIVLGQCIDSCCFLKTWCRLHPTECEEKIKYALSEDETTIKHPWCYDIGYDIKGNKIKECGIEGEEGTEMITSPIYCGLSSAPPAPCCWKLA